MDPIGEILNNIYDERFIGWTHEGKIQFTIIPHGYNIPTSRKKICSLFRPRVFVDVYLAFFAVVLGKEGSLPHWFFDCMFDQYKWKYQDHLLVNKCNLAGLKLM